MQTQGVSHRKDTAHCERHHVGSERAPSSDDPGYAQDLGNDGRDSLHKEQVARFLRVKTYSIHHFDGSPFYFICCAAAGIGGSYQIDGNGSKCSGFYIPQNGGRENLEADQFREGGTSV